MMIQLLMELMFRHVYTGLSQKLPLMEEPLKLGTPLKKYVVEQMIKAKALAELRSFSAPL